MSEGVSIPVRRRPGTEDLPLPAYASAGAAGLDVAAAVDAPVELLPGRRALIPTGLEAQLPAGYELQVRPRSGLALRHGVTVLNAPGTIDSDYRGEILILLANFGEEPFWVRRGDRIAQLVLASVTRAAFQPADALDATARGPGGFGSSGRR